MHQDEAPYQQAASALKKSSTTIAITGAGASVESGIPDFRSPGGLWKTYPPKNSPPSTATYKTQTTSGPSGTNSAKNSPT